MSDSRVEIGDESISGSGANSHADATVSGESRKISNIFADCLAAIVNPLVRIYHSYDDTNTGAYGNGTDHDNPCTRAGADSTHGQREGHCDPVAHSAVELGHKRIANDNNVGTKKRKLRRSHQAGNPPESPLAKSYSSAVTLRHDSRLGHSLSGGHTIVSLENAASNAIFEEPISSFRIPNLDNLLREPVEDEQVAYNGMERLCSERGYQFLNSDKSTLEERVVRSKVPMLELMSDRDTSEFNPELICLPLSGFNPHQEDRLLDKNPTYTKNRSAKGLEVQRLNATIVQGRAAQKAGLISEQENASNNSLLQDLDKRAVTVQLQNDHLVAGMLKAQRKNDDLYLPSESCARETAQRLQFTSANAVDHNLNASIPKGFTQPAIGRSLVVDLTCQVCSKTCVSLSHLTTHMISHTCKKPFACAECGKASLQSGNLSIHMRSHTGEKPFACAECDKRIQSSGQLTVHMRSHTGEKPFACAECDKRFSRNNSLSIHMRSHTGEHPFVCAKCNKRFSLIGDLITHITGEKPFACVDCDKRFRSSRQLAVHMRSHTGEKPFACKECDKSFSFKASLSIHMRSHTSVKPYAYAFTDCPER
ncbi:Zinc-finger of C2H2 type [Metschnikowia aff. pulcherrima]|uniref:Zinc-finger of C2H2 type n=1 Tax=Metschnikowia aff. pulcherrima TaxID=2163413 RepID=A0A4P6XTN6_9ASCO|nr:Zinc-finger of C2H2 type [Metschnikowia aff. pulcherrima]